MAYTTINKSSDYFNTKLYTGNATQRTIDVGFKPDLVWGKLRSTTGNHWLWDSIRGANYYLKSNATDANNTGGVQDLNGFVSNGFTVGTGTRMNTNSETMASWNWLANGQGSSNTDGSINTTYTSANTTSGFSIVKWTSTDTAGSTIGHGLGAVPKMIITKKLTGGNPNYWTTYHNSIGNTKSIFLNDTGAESGASTSYWNDTSPTSSVFSTGTYFDAGDYIAYCFADVQGYSKFGSYTGNGSSSSGTFIYTGFKPAWVLVKRTNASGNNWQLHDIKRTQYAQPINHRIAPNSNLAEQTGDTLGFDFVSNGFRPNNNNADYNGSGSTYIYMAFAEAPLVGTNNVPCTAR